MNLPSLQRRAVRLLLAALLRAMPSHAQQEQAADTAAVFTLPRCIELALANNPQVRQAGFQAATNHVNVTGAWGNLLPNVSGAVNHGINQGRSIDPFTNTYVDQRIDFANYNLSGNVTIWNGLSQQNALQQSRLVDEAGRQDLRQTRENLTINVMLAYLQILNADEQWRQAQQQAAVTARQVARLRTLDSTGAIAPAALHDLRGQLAGDHLNALTMRNNAQAARLALAQLLNLPFNPALRVAPLAENQLPVNAPPLVGPVVQNALATLPQVKAAELRLRGAQRGLRAARGQWWPAVYLFGNVGTTYSSAALRARAAGGTEVIPYSDQWRNNRFSTLGVGIQIPLLNGLQVRTRIGLARIAEEQAAFQAHTVQNAVQQAVTQAVLNQQLAQDRYRTLEQQVEDFALSFQAAEARFEAGVGNAVDYMVAKNNLDRARSNLIAARYDVALRRQIVRYYEGQALP